MAVILSSQDGAAVLLDGAPLDVAGWRLGPAAGAQEQSGARVLTVFEAFDRLSRAGSLRHLVVGLIGPREASAAQYAAAEAVAARLGGLGLTLICGGRGGVMEAASKGCSAAGGLMIGILPGHDPGEANAHVAVPLPTGLSEGRNMVIAKAARVLVAIGGSYGTLSEVAYGLHFSKPVIGLEGAPDIEGVRQTGGVDEAVEATLGALIDTARSTGTAGTR